MKIRTEEHAFIFEEYEYTIPDDFYFPLEAFKEMTDEEQLHYLQSNDFDCERIYWEYGDESRIDNIEIIE